MNRSESIAALAAALAKAQGEMGGAAKGKINPHFKSRYADMESVVDAIKKPLADNSLAYFQTLLTNEQHEVGVQTLVMHSSGEWILPEPFYVPVTKQDAQGFGSAATYARRYSLMAAFGIAPEDDDGNAAAKAAPEERKAPIVPNLEGQERLEQADPEVKRWLQEEAMDIMASHKEGKNLADRWDNAHYTNEEKLMLNVLLPSDVRRKIKDQQRQKINSLATQA